MRRTMIQRSCRLVALLFCRKTMGGIKISASLNCKYEVEHVTDWDSIKTEYITTDISLRDLADKHGVPASTMMQASAKNGWRIMREQHKSNVIAKTVAKAEQTKINRLASLQSAADKAAQLIDGVVAKIAEMEQSDDGKTVNIKALRDIAATLKDMTITMRNLYDLPTIQEQEAMSIARERLRIDKDKDTTDNNITIKLAMPDEWAK